MRAVAGIAIFVALGRAVPITHVVNESALAARAPTIHHKMAAIARRTVLELGEGASEDDKSLFMDMDEMGEPCFRLNAVGEQIAQSYTQMVYIAVDDDDKGDACVVLENDEVPPMVQRHKVGIVREETCADNYPYEGISYYMSGLGPFLSCADIAAGPGGCDAPRCPYIANRLKTQWCPQTCGTCSGGAPPASAAAAAPVAIADPESSCADNYPYRGGVTLSGLGPFFSCNDMKSACNTIRCLPRGSHSATAREPCIHCPVPTDRPPLCVSQVSAHQRRTPQQVVPQDVWDLYPRGGHGGGSFAGGAKIGGAQVRSARVD